MKPIVYADGSSFFYSYNKNVDPTNIINPKLVKIVKWLNVNKLSLNINKSNFIIFCPSYKQKGPELIPKIELQGQQIQQVAQTKFLGIIIENDMTWQAHIKFLCNKTAKSIIGIIQKARVHLDTDTLVGLYYFFIYPYLSNGITVWGKATKSVLEPLFKLQKKVIRLVFNKPQRTPSIPLFIKSNILPLDAIYTLAVSSFMFKVHYRLSPTIITSLFNKRNKLVQRTTRQSEHYNLPLLGGSILEKSIFTQGPKIFNQIIKDGNIDLKCSIHNFKRHVKSKLMRKLKE